jgi:hypothetical protein
MEDPQETLDLQVQEVLARLGLLALAPLAQQAGGIRDLRVKMARLAQQVPPESKARQDLVDRWAHQALPVLQALRGYRGPLDQPACLELLERQVLRAASAHKGLKE